MAKGVKKNDSQSAQSQDAPSAPSKVAAGGRGKPARIGDAHVGKALRSAYQETVQEEIPREMLDLLDKLS